MPNAASQTVPRLEFRSDKIKIIQTLVSYKQYNAVAYYKTRQETNDFFMTLPLLLSRFHLGSITVFVAVRELGPDNAKILNLNL